MKGRLFLGVLLGIILTVVGYKAAASLCIITDTHRHFIPVDNNGQIPSDENDAYISLAKNHTVFWQADASKTLQIQFEVAKFPTGKQPFKVMTFSPDKKYAFVTCKGYQCDSGPINPDLKGDLKPLTCLKFPYDQVLGDQKKDGWIIIDK
jgi:hypothetical protein